jgi:hypothetical protein
MSAFAGFFLGHPIVSIWLAMMCIGWLFIYAASKVSEAPETDARPAPPANGPRRVSGASKSAPA